MKLAHLYRNVTQRFEQACMSVANNSRNGASTLHHGGDAFQIRCIRFVSDILPEKYYSTPRILKKHHAKITTKVCGIKYDNGFFRIKRFECNVCIMKLTTYGTFIAIMQKSQLAECTPSTNIFLPKFLLIKTLTLTELATADTATIHLDATFVPILLYILASAEPTTFCSYTLKCSKAKKIKAMQKISAYQMSITPNFMPEFIPFLFTKSDTSLLLRLCT